MASTTGPGRGRTGAPGPRWPPRGAIGVRRPQGL